MSLHCLFEVIAYNQVSVPERGVAIVRILGFPVSRLFSYLLSFTHVIGHPCVLPTVGNVDHWAALTSIVLASLIDLERIKKLRTRLICPVPPLLSTSDKKSSSRARTGVGQYIDSLWYSPACCPCHQGSFLTSLEGLYTVRHHLCVRRTCGNRRRTASVVIQFVIGGEIRVVGRLSFGSIRVPVCSK